MRLIREMNEGKRERERSIDDCLTAGKPDEPIYSNQPSAISNQHQIRESTFDLKPDR